MKIAYYQFSPKIYKTKKNITDIYNKLYNLKEHADLIVLPELSTSGYFITDKSELFKLALNKKRRELEDLKNLCIEKKYNIVIGLPELDEGNIYNSAFLIKSSGEIESYRKNHLFYKEKLVFNIGNKGFPVFDINGVKIAILICYDHMFPEAARKLALNGAQIICHPSNLVMPEYGQLTSRVRALENRVFWILANRTGTETNSNEKLTFTGKSQIVSPKGKILLSSDSESNEIRIIEIDPEEALNKNLNPLNEVFNDRRTDIY